MSNKSVIQYKFTKERTEVIYSTKEKVTSKIFPLGYQMFNLISLEFDDIQKILETSKLMSLDLIKEDYDTFEIAENINVIEYFFIPEILNNDSIMEIEKGILFIKYFFETVNLKSITLETFLNILTEFNLRVPCCGNYRITKDYSNIDLFAEKSLEQFSEHLKMISDLLHYNVNDETIYYCDNFIDVLIACVHYILSNGYSIKKCEVCGCLYIPSRSDTLYCDRTSPYDDKKTCKEYGAYQAYQESLKKSEPAKLYRNIYMAKQNRALRNSEYPMFVKDFEDFRTNAKEWQSKLKSGIVTNDEYLAWLKEVQGKKR